jgi:hypothetical protein
VQSTLFHSAAAVVTALILSGCAAFEPQPGGLSPRILFSVSPLFPKSYEITAAGPRYFSAEKLKEAWQKKALLVANGHHFRTSPFVVHDDETVQAGFPMQSRSVTATITLID